MSESRRFKCPRCHKAEGFLLVALLTDLVITDEGMAFTANAPDASGNRYGMQCAACNFGDDRDEDGIEEFAGTWKVKVELIAR